MELDYKAIGARIRAKREQMGYTREQLAEKLDISSKFCSDIELGARGMSLATLVNLSQALYLSTDYILFGDETDKDSSPLLILAQQIPDEQLDSVIKLMECAVAIANN